MSYPDSVIALFFTWISVIIGTLLGLVFLCAGGPSKTIPCFPHHQWIASFFQKVVGPFFTNGHKSGNIIRLVVGWNEMISGVIFVACLWIDAMRAGSPSTVDNARALLLHVACLQVFMLGAQALMFYDLNDGNPGTSGWTAGLVVVFLCLRILACPPWFLSYPNQVLIFIAGLIIPIPFLALAVMRYKWGAPLRDIQPEYASMKKKPQGSNNGLNGPLNGAPNNLPSNRPRSRSPVRA